MLVHKLAGAAAERGLPLAEVAAIARSAAAALGSRWAWRSAPAPCPSVGKPGFELGDDEIELGLGIHGEKGVERTDASGADQIVASLLDAIVADLDLKSGAKVALLVNGLGGTPPMELAVVARARPRRPARARHPGRARLVGQFHDGDRNAGLFAERASARRRSAAACSTTPTDVPVWPGDGRIGRRILVRFRPSRCPRRPRQARCRRA